MAYFSLRCKLWLLFVLLTTSVCAHPIMKESKITIQCPYDWNQNVTWQVRSGNDFIDAISCTFDSNICVSYMPHQYRGEVENSTKGLISYLLITSVRINETEFRCLRRYDDLRIKMEVYARPSNPLCDPVELDYTKKNLQFRCRTTHVFPSVSAILYIRGVDFLKHGVLSTHCANEETGTLTLDGYSAECIWRIPAARLEPLKYGYYVKMFPNLSNSTGIDVPDAVSQDYTLQLSSPVAGIDYSQCPVGPGVVDGKIITGSTATCKCVLESPGFPSGQARWYKHNGNHSLGRDDTTDGSSTLVIDTNISGQSYTCGAESPLNNHLNWGPVYTPVFISDTSQSCKCGDDSSPNNSLHLGPVYTPAFTRTTTPRSNPETYSLTIEIVAGIVAGSVLLTLIIAAVLWKWRSRRRLSADTTSVVYNRSSVDTASDPDYLKVYENYEQVF